jgi:ribose transport system ATP-binding protein
MGEVLVLMEGIEKIFPGVHALSQCKFELRSGEVHALVGENGAGKSTLMKILTGVYKMNSGRILYKNKEVTINGTRDAQNLGISIIHQELNLMPHLSVAQNIFIGREPRRAINFILDDKKLNSITEELLDMIHLDVNPQTKVSDLVVAKQQMVEIAKALSYNSEVLIMDEPTAALTSSEIDELFTIIRKLRENGVGIVYISHRMDELKKISDRITVMRDGMYIDTVETEKSTIDQIISMMVGRVIYESKTEIPEKTSSDVVLEVKNLNRGKHIKKVNFSLKKGEILGFAGLMGAGRTEVARAIFGADKFDSGEIFVNGKKVKIKKPKDAVNYGIGYLSEDRKRFGLALGMDTETNIVLAAFSRFTRFWV